MNGHYQYQSTWHQYHKVTRQQCRSDWSLSVYLTPVPQSDCTWSPLGSPMSVTPAWDGWCHIIVIVRYCWYIYLRQPHQHEMADVMSSPPSGTPTSATPTWDGWCRIIIDIRYTHQSHQHYKLLMLVQAAMVWCEIQPLLIVTLENVCATDFRPETHPDNCVWNQTSFESLNDAIIVTFVGGFGPIFRLLHAVLVLGVDFRSCLHCTGWCTIDVLIPPISTRQWVCVDDGWWV